ncbi:MAG: polysaccharide deacetylase family protein [Candidatus Omnitrophica bacterium]|nr:polysaccharide deacetylase family protein [Candidatus Omnitrophota bacterium]
MINSFKKSKLFEYCFRRVSFPGVAVLCYHGIRNDYSPEGTIAWGDFHVTVREFTEHCRFVHDFCDPISLNEFLAAKNGLCPLPKRPVLFTFDDGYRSVFTLARPILRKFNIPALVFLSSNYIEKRCLFWFDTVFRKFGAEEVYRLKATPFNQWKYGDGIFNMPANDDDPNTVLSKEEIIELSDSGSFEFGSHTLDHLILSKISLEEQKKQIYLDKKYIQALIDKPVRVFAYPNGRPGIDYTEKSVKIVLDLGFEAAFSTRFGFTALKDSNLECSRFFILSRLTPFEFSYILFRTALVQRFHDLMCVKKK